MSGKRIDDGEIIVQAVALSLDGEAFVVIWNPETPMHWVSDVVGAWVANPELTIDATNGERLLAAVEDASDDYEAD